MHTAIATLLIHNTFFRFFFFKFKDLFLKQQKKTLNWIKTEYFSIVFKLNANKKRFY